MARVRILGPGALLPHALRVLQDFGELHLVGTGDRGGVRPAAPAGPESRRAAQLRRALHDVEAAAALLDHETRSRKMAAPGADPGEASGTGEVPGPRDFARWHRLARRVATEAAAVRERIRELEEERALLSRYEEFFGGFRDLLERAAGWTHAVAYHVVVRERESGAVPALRDALTKSLGSAFEMVLRPLSTGETGVLLLVRAADAPRVDALLVEAQVQELPLPGSLRGRTPAEAVRTLLERLGSIPEELERERGRLRDLAERYAGPLARARRSLRDRLAELDALTLAGRTEHAFVVEGWLPAESLGRLRAGLTQRLGDTLVVEEVDREEWRGEHAPVVLRNPRIFRPFELLVSLFPLPRYGTIDPTPYMAVVFPMMFGLILGDMGYGLMAAVLALVLHRVSREGTLLRSASEILGACAAFAIIFGFLFGELFGDAGARWLGLHPILFHREEALLPFLGLAVALGAVHMLLGLVLAVVAGLHEGPRHALGPGLTAAMLVLVALALLAAFGVLPRAFFTPAVVALLVAFPILVVVEGLVAPVEFLSTLGHILSYARVMAIGTASVMMAVAANRMVGTFGSVTVGALFALLFHLVNFAMGLFSPTIHALRLHYVEFFGTFYSPGGMRYEPFGHWRPGPREPDGSRPARAA